MSVATVSHAAPEAAAHAGVVTTQAFLVGGIMPSVEALARALRDIRGARHTEDVVGFAIPLDGDPADGMIRERVHERPVDDGFSMRKLPDMLKAFPAEAIEFLTTAMDPHGSRVGSAGFGRWAPGKNAPLALDVLGSLTRWLVGIQPFRLHDVPDQGDIWVLGRPNHSAAVNTPKDLDLRRELGLAGDATEGYVGLLATFGVPAAHAQEYAARLVGGECLLTTCETDVNRSHRDEKIMRRAGARDFFPRVELAVRYGARPT